MKLISHRGPSGTPRSGQSSVWSCTTSRVSPPGREIENFLSSTSSGTFWKGLTWKSRSLGRRWRDGGSWRLQLPEEEEEGDPMTNDKEEEPPPALGPSLSPLCCLANIGLPLPSDPQPVVWSSQSQKPEDEWLILRVKDAGTFSCMTMCQKCENEFGFGALQAMKVWAQLSNLIRLAFT